MPVDVGLDRQLVGAYGHDDRSNGYAAFRAITEVGTPDKTAIAYGVNNEEVSSWTTGVESEWFRTLLAEIIAAQEPSYNDLMLRHALRASQVLVSDCTTALDPNFPQPYLPNGSARLGWGLVFKEYGAGREADAEFFARIRSVFNDAGVRWQTHSYKAGYGGGTIAQWFANAEHRRHRCRNRHSEHAFADGRVRQGRSLGALSRLQGLSGFALDERRRHADALTPHRCRAGIPTRP